MDGSALPGGRRQRRKQLGFGLILLLAAGGVAVLEHYHGDAIGPSLREIGLTILAPVRWVADLPAAYERARADARDADNLQAIAAQWREELLLAQAQLAGVSALEAENNRLRELLSASARIQVQFQVVDVARRDLHPYPQRAVLQAGRRDGLAVGQPVLGRAGILGQIRSVTEDEAVLTLATEADHAIPALLQRNGAKTIVHGTGGREKLRVSWLPQNTDIRVGDLLVSSGLGGRFPPDYPLAEITRVTIEPGERFLLVEARPLADIAMNPEVIVVSVTAPP